MTERPDIVIDYLDMMRLRPPRLAWVLLDLKGRITRLGGDLELLGDKKLLVGELAAEQIVGLTGLVPVGKTSTVIPNFQIERSVVVNLHAIPSPVGGCLLLLDASSEHEEKQLRQQRRYDELLAEREKQKKR